jgi:thiol-disulfide isomerase/thioredoxin
MLINSCTNHKSNTSKQTNITFVTDSHLQYTDILPAYVTDQLKGKLVYVDIWGTWCRPCREEIPFSKTLQSKFENEDVAFLFLCCHCEESSWKKMVNDFQLPGIHIILNEDQLKLLEEKYQIMGFPSYMIFGKNGELQYGDAPRPSSRSTEGILRGLLKNSDPESK